MIRDQYIKEVLSHIEASKRIKKRIYEDLTDLLESVSELNYYDEIVDKFGKPEKMAEDFMENLDIPDEYYGVTIGLSRRKRSYEYTSSKKIFGLPLIHIAIGGRYKNLTAKGFIAIGDISFGIISIGGISAGLVSFGGISFGLIAIGGISAGLISVGAVSVGLISIGAISVGVYQSIGAITKLIK